MKRNVNEVKRVISIVIMLLFAGAILITLSKLEHILKGKFENLIQILSKYSYSIILVHWYALFAVTWNKMGIRPELFGCVGGIILTVFVSVIVCFIMGFVAENTVVLALQYLINSLGKRVCNKKSNS